MSAGMSPEEMATELTALRVRVAQLEEDSDKLGALYEAGVDNWSGYDYAMKILHGDES